MFDEQSDYYSKNILQTKSIAYKILLFDTLNIPEGDIYCYIKISNFTFLKFDIKEKCKVTALLAEWKIIFYTYVSISGRLYFLNFDVKQKCEVTTCHFLAYLEDYSLYMCES